MKNGFENSEDMKKMQQDAIKRAHEMNTRAKKNSHFEKNENSQNTEDEQEKCEDQTKLDCSKEHSESSKEASKNSSLIDTLFSDPEKSLILILIFIFLDEDTNPILIMALMYLLM